MSKLTKLANATEAHRIYRQFIRSKQYKKFKKAYGAVIIIGLMLYSAAMSGFYLGGVANVGHEAPVAGASEKPVAAAGSQDLNGMIDDAVNACYYDTYQQNDTVNSGDICNKVMMSYKELCKTVSLDVCHSEFFTKYLRGMEG